MSEDRRTRLEAMLVTADQAGNGQSGSRISRICGACVAELAVTGAGATVLAHLGDGDGQERSPGRGLVHASDTVSAGLEDLQLTVGEGPCLDAFHSGGPVLVGDLAAEATTRWPGFTPGAVELGAAAVFSFPLHVGVVRLGSIDCYRELPGPLSPAQLTDGLILADLAAQAVMGELDGHDSADLSWLSDAHSGIHQATGMVQAQLNTTTQAALLRLRGHAYTHELALTEVGRQVVARTLRFTPEDT